MIPSTYQLAERLPVDAKIALDAAARAWRELASTPARARALRRCPQRGSLRACADVRAATLEAMVLDGLLEVERGLTTPAYLLTPWGAAVRDAGTRGPR